MTEHTVRLRKRSGGSGLTHHGKLYEWPHNGAVTEVPHALAKILLAIQDGDYSVEGEPPPARGVVDVAPASVRSARDSGLAGSEEGAEDEDAREVTEPAPSSVHVVTEPAPKGKVAEAGEGSKAPESGRGSPVTPRSTASTRRTPPSRAARPAARGAAAKK
jgi:hypothetical protein